MFETAELGRKVSKEEYTREVPLLRERLLEAQVACLKGKPYELYPDFPTGGLLDVSEYNDGNGKMLVCLFPDADDDAEWRATPFPFFDGEEIEAVNLFVRGRQRGKRDDEQDVRFVVQLELSALGAMQLDGFDYAFRFPGLIRVKQSAGRVIRDERDREWRIFLSSRNPESALEAYFVRP